ncbi:MAG: undecaprenyl-diphosphate phosphatase [Maricaulaceae bacterium]|nr:undecaprenyl-diphosphate phosphatase [Maricaulaceae bacterium]
MLLIHLIVLALVQGITEFLPVSSSGHLVLAPWVFGFEPQSALVDVMAHLGSLAAVFVYFRREIWSVITGVFGWLSGKMTPGGRLALLVLIATPPVMVAGGVLYLSGLADVIRNPAVIAAATIVFAIPLWLADRYAPRVKTVETLSIRDAVFIGLAQMVSMIPGASRSGLMMTMARALGADRKSAARFAMISSIPVLLAFAAVAVLELARGADPGAGLGDGLIVAALSFASCIAVIHLMMKLVEKIGFGPFVVYRLILGGVIVTLLMING